MSERTTQEGLQLCLATIHRLHKDPRMTCEFFKCYKRTVYKTNNIKHTKLRALIKVKIMIKTQTTNFPYSRTNSLLYYFQTKITP